MDIRTVNLYGAILLYASRQTPTLLATQLNNKFVWYQRSMGVTTWKSIPEHIVHVLALFEIG